MYGAGKYDDICTIARTEAQAEGALLIIINGTLGSGFSAQVDMPTLLRLPTLLREVANHIEADAKETRHHG